MLIVYHHDDNNNSNSRRSNLVMKLLFNYLMKEYGEKLKNELGDPLF